MILVMAPAASEEPDPLVTASEEQSEQLREAGGALAEAVSALRGDLEQRREEVARLSQQNEELQADNRALRNDAERLPAAAGTPHERRRGREAHPQGGPL